MKLCKKGKFWYYRFQAGGREIYRSARVSDKETAKQIAEQVYRETVLSGHGIRKAPSLSGIAQAWAATKGKTRSAAHRQASAQCLASLAPLAKTAIDRLTQGAIDAWMAKYLENHARSSANQCLRYLKLWLKWAIAEGYLRELPCALRQEKIPNTPRPVVPLEKVNEFLSACERRNPQIPLAVKCAVMLGLREKEILNLRWENLQGGLVIVRGKGDKTRKIPVPRPLQEAFGWFLLAKAQQGPAQKPDMGLVFPGADGKPHVHGWLRQALKRGAEEIGIPPIGIHRLRATFATLHLRQKTPLKEVQAMMGHASAATTLIYHETSTDEQARHQAELWGAG